MSEILDESWQPHIASTVAHWSEMAKAAIDSAAVQYERPCVLFKPRLSIDGNQWCALYGDNLQDGAAGFGDSPADAMRDFDRNWNVKLAQEARRKAEPDMRHPRIQALIGSNARQNIRLQIIDQLLEDPNVELTAMDMEYWDSMHDKIREALLAQPQVERKPLTDEQIRTVWESAGRDCAFMLHDIEFARAIERAHGIGGNNV